MSPRKPPTRTPKRRAPTSGRLTAINCRCGVWVLTGWDAPVCGIWRTLDPWRLDGRGEVAAVLAGRGTYRVWGWPGRWEVTGRYDPTCGTFGVPHDPPEVVTVIADHECGKRPLSTEALALFPPNRAEEADGPPPF